MKTLEDLSDAFGENRSAAVCKELSKIHEAYFRGNLGGLPQEIPSTALKGEFVLVVEGATEKKARHENKYMDKEKTL